MAGKMTRWLILVAASMAGACSSDGGNNNQIQAPNTKQALAIDVPASLLSGDFRLDGGNFPASVYHRGVLALHDPQINGLTILGESWDGSYVDLMVVDGTYDSLYGQIDGDQVPQNELSVTAAAQAIDTDQALDIDVASSTVVPSFTVNGAAFPASVYQSAEFFLRPSGSSQLISLGRTHDQPAENVMVVPGTYDVIYSIREGDQLPQNEYATVMSQVAIASSPYALDVNIVSSSLDAAWRLATNGVLADFPASIYHSGRFELRTDEGDYAALGQTQVSSGPVVVIAGTYDVVYNHFNGSQVPQNTGKVIENDLVVPAGRLLYEGVINAWTAQPSFSTTGGAFPASVYESGEIFLVDSDTSTLTSLGRTHLATEPVLLIEGSYDAMYSHVDGVSIPQNSAHRLGVNLVVDEADELLDINVASAAVTGDFQLDGGDFPSSVYESATFELVPVNGGDPIDLGQSSKPMEAVVVAAGNYDIVYKHANGQTVPRNPYHVLAAAHAIAGNGSLSFNVPSRVVSPTFTLNGQAFPASVYERGELFLRGSHEDDYVLLGSSHSAAEDTTVVRGGYDVHYRHVQGESVPRNSDARVTSIVIN